MMRTFKEFFGPATIISLICLAIAAWDGYARGEHTAAALFQALTIALLLGVLEISLSFDNAVVNATVLRTMSEVWQRRFLTWGILIAVFGIRFLFPIIIVALASGMGFIEVVREAFGNPDLYTHHLENAQVSISAFGGTFLMMVFLKYFMDTEKDEHWVRGLESGLARFGQFEGVQLLVTGILLAALVNYTVAPAEQYTALLAGLVGLLTYLAVDGLGSLFETDDAASKVGAAGATAFIYLEVLDASFSLDGVIGAFALTKDVVLIAAGLTIGAIFVRSLTIMMVKKGTLEAYRFLEHGAHYGIGALAIIMLLSMNRNIHIPEVVTGLIGAGFIGLAVWSSLQANKRDERNALN